MIQPYLESFYSILQQTAVTDGTGAIIPDSAAFNQIIRQCNEIRSSHGTVYLIGNGGSSGIISHTGIDLLNKCNIRAYPITDNSLLTCLANDYGYEQVFLKVIEKSAIPNDCLIAVSSSGQSGSIVNAAKKAKQQGIYVVTLSGFTPDNPLRSIGHINFWLNSKNYGHVEIGHSLLLHILTDALWME
jgi:D-sedoheptulose 7-phosphate isomerase